MTRGSYTLLLCICTIVCFGQNQTNKVGLPFGWWEEEATVDGIGVGKGKQQGVYKIISVSDLDTIDRLLGDGMVQVHYKNSTPLLFYTSRHEHTISVKDSIWNTFDSKGRLRRIDLWINGINAWTKYFDESGRLTEHNYDDFENDSVFYFTYHQGRIFKKAFYPPENKNREFETYYPRDNLVISNAELYFSSLFQDVATSVASVKLTSKKEITINDIYNTGKSLAFKKHFQLPVVVKPGDTVTLNIAFAPSPNTFKPYDTIFIVTSEKNVNPYMIFCHQHASHIDAGNVETLQEISLSRTRDKYLFISKMGTVTSAYVESASSLKEYPIKGLTTIDLATLELGTHSLRISSCNYAGTMKLTVVP